jgi:peptide/nickel transport system permease protein
VTAADLDLAQETVVPAPAAGRRRRPVSPSLVVGVLIVGLVVATALLSFFWTPFDPTRVDPTKPLRAPGGEHPLGTDQFGRDILSQMIAGARTTLLVGMISVTISATLGIPLGLLAASGGKWLSEPIMRAMDIVFAFPAILMAIILAAGFGASTLTAMVAIGIATVPIFARLTRAGAVQVLKSDYVLAARGYGRRGPMLMVRYVVPNIAALLIVQASVAFALAVLAEAALSYLGFGTPPPTPSWGRMLQEAQNYLVVRPMLAVWPGIAIALSVLGFNLIGDGLRDTLDPRLKGR